MVSKSLKASQFLMTLHHKAIFVSSHINAWSYECSIDWASSQILTLLFMFRRHWVQIFARTLASHIFTFSTRVWWVVSFTLHPLFGCAAPSLVTMVMELYWLPSIRLERKCNFQLVGILVVPWWLSWWSNWQQTFAWGEGIIRVWFPKNVLFIQTELLAQFNL